jgi:hypothetical protein
MPYCADAETECAAFVAATRNATDCLGLDIQVGFWYCLLDTCYLPLPASLDHGACPKQPVEAGPFSLLDHTLIHHASP